MDTGTAPTLTPGSLDGCRDARASEAKRNQRMIHRSGPVYCAPTKQTEGKAPRRRLHVAHTAAAKVVKRSQKTAPVPSVGRWWGILGRAAYGRVKVVLEVELPAQTAARIAVALQVDWERWSERKGFEPKHWPKWASGPAVERVIAEAGANLDLWGADWVDPATGELLPASSAAVLDEAAFGRAA